MNLLVLLIWLYQKIPIQTKLNISCGKLPDKCSVRVFGDMARKRRRYTDEERASYVAALELAGYQNNGGKNSHILYELADKSGIPSETLRRWWKRSHNPPPDKLVRDKKADFVEAIRDELAQIFVQFDYAREGADYRELATAAGIFIDKLQLLQGRPTGIEKQIVNVTDSRERLANLISNHASRNGTPAITERTQ